MHWRRWGRILGGIGGAGLTFQSTIDTEVDLPHASDCATWVDEDCDCGVRFIDMEPEEEKKSGNDNQ